MAAVTVDLNANRENVGRPILWRLGKLFHVVTNIRRARISEDYGYVALHIEGATREVEQACNYLRAQGLLKDGVEAVPAPEQANPEGAIPLGNPITVRLRTVNPEQSHAPVLHRVGKDYAVVVNIESAAIDEEEGGSIEITIYGVLADIQRAIAYLHTTGLLVNPLQRSVGDGSNL